LSLKSVRIPARRHLQGRERGIRLSYLPAVILITLPLILASDVRDIEGHSRLREFSYYDDEDSNIFPNANITHPPSSTSDSECGTRRRDEPSTGLSIFCTCTNTWMKRYFTPHEQLVCVTTALIDVEDEEDVVAVGGDDEATIAAAASAAV
jgi:hypothetical protein